MSSLTRPTIAGQDQTIKLPKATISHEHTPSFTTHTLDNISVPIKSSFPSQSTNSQKATKRQRTSSGSFRREADDEQSWWNGFREWRGLAAIGSSRLKWRSEVEADDEEEQWGIGQTDCEQGRTTALSLNGLLHPRAVRRSMDKVLQEPL